MFHFCIFGISSACYGIVQVPTGPWFCRKCESQERAARVVSHMVSFFFFFMMNEKTSGLTGLLSKLTIIINHIPILEQTCCFRCAEKKCQDLFQYVSVWNYTEEAAESMHTDRKKIFDFHTDLPTTFVSMQAGFFLKCTIALCPFAFAGLSFLDLYIL